MRDYNLPIIGGAGFKGRRIDRKLCFELWVYRGTAKKASIALQKEFKIFNKRLNKPYSDVSVMRAAKLYILNNPDEARATWEEHYGEISDELWYDYLLRTHVMLSKYNSTRYAEWRKEHPEVVEYEKSLKK